MTALLCLDSTESPSLVSESDCVEVADATGALGPHFRVVLTTPDGTRLTLRN